MIRFPAMVAVLLLCGCGGDGAGGPKGNLSGKVTLKGEALDAGSINIVAVDKNMYQGTIRAGTYRVEGIPVGDVKIAVIGRERVQSAADAKDIKSEVEAPNPKIAKLRKKRAAAAKEGKKQPVGFAYGDAETSGLKATIKAGENTADFDLK
jgi:hypothetical protein